VLCDKNGGYYGDNVLYHETSGGKYLPRAVFFDLEPGVIDAGRIAARLAHPPGKPRVPYTRVKLGKRPLQKG
jgi:hypothetical protein